MEVKLIAMTDVMYENEPAGSVESAEQVCNHAAKTCTKEDAGDLVGQHYIVGEPCLIWEDNDLRPLGGALASGHESILEHAVYTFEIKGVSRALTHQLVRHRIASYSQQSQRYVNMEDFDYIIPKSMSDKVIAKSIDPITLEPKEITLEMEYMNIIEDLHNAYKRLIENGVPEEDARYILPNATCTNIIVTMNARQLRHFFALRCCERAQWEIRALANRMLRICKEVSPDIFANAGPSCAQLGYCPEQRSCGRAIQLNRMLEIIDEIDCEESIRDEQRTAERECHR